MTVVSNTSPISNLAAIGHLDLLQRLYGSITIPQAVANEIAKVATIYIQAASVPNQPWITIQAVNDAVTVERLRGEKLDAGESEAIALALEIGAELLLIDEQLGRKIAINEGLNITGLVGVLLEAKNRGFASKIKPIVDALVIQARFRVSSQLYAEVLRLAGEA
ncbi:MAG: DUF3368 domain-containing protein [Leptolyngbyaceae cyanobacterium SM2_5_2]|nr:DUF3368 domain-containing protein [Leptolyngbyaceae cyanobacterium SM2_5_2]